MKKQFDKLLVTQLIAATCLVLVLAGLHLPKKFGYRWAAVHGDSISSANFTCS